MLCQNCKMREATTHVKSVVNSKSTELYLCSECAEEMGYDTMFEPFSMGMGSLLGNFLGASTGIPTSLIGVDRCPGCGSAYADIVASGKVGCAECYEKFYDKLIPSIENIHGRVSHIGKTAKQGAAPVPEKEPDRIGQLEKELKAAVQEQNYERAAQLRDRIKALRKGEGEEK